MDNFKSQNRTLKRLKNICIIILFSLLLSGCDSQSHSYTIKNNDNEITIEIPIKYSHWTWEKSEIKHRSFAVNYYDFSPMELAPPLVKSRAIKDFDKKYLGIFITGNLVNPSSTISSPLPDYCRASPSLGYKIDSKTGHFARYVREKSYKSHDKSLHIIYIPEEKTEGLHCIYCEENATCKMLAVSSQGIEYTAFYSEKRMPDEWENIYKKLDSFFEKILEK